MSEICLTCFGGGYFLMHAPDSIDLVPCETCRGRGEVTCSRCNDTGWMPEMDAEGHYDSDIPCVCEMGMRLMRSITRATEDFQDEHPF